MAYAKLGKMPMILVSGQKPLREDKQGCFQMVDVLGMAEPVSHFSQSVAKAAAAPSLCPCPVKLGHKVSKTLCDFRRDYWLGYDIKKKICYGFCMR